MPTTLSPCLFFPCCRKYVGCSYNITAFDRIWITGWLFVHIFSLTSNWFMARLTLWLEKVIVAGCTVQHSLAALKLPSSLWRQFYKIEHHNQTVLWFIIEIAFVIFSMSAHPCHWYFYLKLVVTAGAFEAILVHFLAFEWNKEVTISEHLQW